MAPCTATRSGLPIDEQHPTDPIVPYGISKLAGEKYVALHERLFGVPGRILRCSNVYGERQPTDRNQGVVAVLLESIRAGEVFAVVGDGSVVRDYLYVRDLAAVVTELLAVGSAPKLLNVASGEGVSVSGLTALAEEITGKAPHVEYLPSRSFDISSVVLDVSLLRETLRFEPVSVRDGMSRTWRSLTGRSRTGSPSATGRASVGPAVGDCSRRVQMQSSDPGHDLELGGRGGLELAAQSRELRDALARVSYDAVETGTSRSWRHIAPARRARGILRRVLRRLRVRRGGAPRPVPVDRFVYSLDAPKAGQLIGPDRFVDVGGWALCPSGPVARIEVSVDGRDCGKARLGLPRPHVAAHYASAEAPISGFGARIDLDQLPQAAVARIDVSVEALAGDRHRLDPVVVRLPPTTGEHGAESYDSPSFGPARAIGPPGDIRLLVFTHHLGLGGGQLYLFELLRLLSREPGFWATAIAPTDGVLRERTEALGIPVIVNGSHPLASADAYEERQSELAAWARDAGSMPCLQIRFSPSPASIWPPGSASRPSGRSTRASTCRSCSGAPEQSTRM